MMKEYWNRFLHWRGWKKIFPLPAGAALLMFLACGAGLIWVFVNGLELSQAIFAIFSLQAGLLRTFGTGESWEHWLNLAVGCVVCLLTVAMGIYMIRRANRKIEILQESQNEKSLF